MEKIRLTASNNANATLNSDRPIEDEADDLLGYGPLARTIAHAINALPSRANIVSAVHGKWGSGKTSLSNLIVKHIDKENISVIRFNPWWFAQQEDLTVAFFTEIVRSMTDIGF